MRKLAFLSTLAVIVLAAGCDSSTPQATAEQNKNFNGGPMPKDWQERMSKSQAGAEEHATEAKNAAGR